jgi:SAM-dependent methyltransferase
MTQDSLPWYELGLPVQERRQRGHFSTPPLLVEHILDACGYTPDRDLSAIRVLDPACGSGNFLIAAAKRLIASGKRTGTSHKILLDRLHRNLWGFDPDPVACFLAETALRTTITDLTKIRSPRHPLHIHQADGLAFPWQRSTSFDLFLANPPYLAAKNTDLSHYHSGQQHGQQDSYLFFLELALQIVRPAGWIGLILPDPVLARMNAAGARKRLLSETTIHHLWHLSDVFEAYVGAVVIIAQKCPPPVQHVIRWRRERWRPDQISATSTPSSIALSPNTVSQSLLHAQPHTTLSYLLGDEQSTAIHHIHSHLYQPLTQIIPAQCPFAFLEDFLSISRGEELGKKSPLLVHSHPEQAHHYPVLRGGSDVHPYQQPQPLCSIHEKDVFKPLPRYLVPKLVVVKSMNHLCSTLDLNGCVVLQTLYMLHLRQPLSSPPTPPCNAYDDLYFFLALLNSRFLNKYIYTLYTAYKWVQPQIEQHVLAHLPIPRHVDPSLKQAIIRRARQLLELGGISEEQEHFQKMYVEQEQDIQNLYTTTIEVYE